MSIDINVSQLNRSLDINDQLKLNLADLKTEERKILCQQLLQEQVINQRNMMHFWGSLTKQPTQIDSGYIGQHLVSLITGIEGGGMRGKGLDIKDGSEIKTANFLDSLDINNSTAPRWNFPCNSEEEMLEFLKYPAIYLVSLDFRLPDSLSQTNYDKLLNSAINNPIKTAFINTYVKKSYDIYSLDQEKLNSHSDSIRKLFSRYNFEEDNIRIRVWKVIPNEHEILKTRYHEWMEQKGYVKLNSGDRSGINFQLFPPHYFSFDNFARHGNGRDTDFDKLQIPLENIKGAKKIFEAIEINNTIEITHFDS